MPSDPETGVPAPPHVAAWAVLLLALSSGSAGCGNQESRDDGFGSDAGVRVGPAGGTFKFPNGVVLEIPSAALASTVTISVRELSCTDVDRVLSAQRLSSHSKRCLGGFFGEPGGLTFARPVTATIPVAALRGGEVPLAMSFDDDLRGFRPLPTVLSYRGGENAAQMSLEHFSASVVAAADAESSMSVESPDLPACCTSDKSGKIGADCCCFTQTITSGDAESSSSNCNGCQLVRRELTVKYPNCPGAGDFHLVETGSAGTCPPDLEAVITGPTEPFWACQTVRFEAVLSGTNDGGSTCTMPLPVKWSVESDTAQVSLTDQGVNSVVLRANQAGHARLLASVLLGEGFTKESTLDVRSLSGTWTLDFSGTEACTRVESDAFQAPVVLTQDCSSIVVASPEYPNAEPLRGALTETADPEHPFTVDLFQSSDHTVDCLIFTQSSGRDIAFGDPFCTNPDVDCYPISCSEDFGVSGTVARAGNDGVVGESQWNFNATWRQVDHSANPPRDTTESASCAGIGIYQLSQHSLGP